jgi:L-serine dehydratase
LTSVNKIFIIWLAARPFFEKVRLEEFQHRGLDCAGLTALGGSNEQVEHAAEIALEHNLGMTCNPIGGFLQIPCIERNAFGAVQAVNAARMAMNGNGEHRISFDRVVRTMHETGRAMRTQYKEGSLAGVTVNVVEC